MRLIGGNIRFTFGNGQSLHFTRMSQTVRPDGSLYVRLWNPGKPPRPPRTRRPGAPRGHYHRLSQTRRRK